MSIHWYIIKLASVLLNSFCNEFCEKLTAQLNQLRITLVYFEKNIFLNFDNEIIMQWFESNYNT